MLRLTSCLIALTFVSTVLADEAKIPFAALPAADSKLEVGKPVTAAVGKKCVVGVTTSAKKVTWRYPPEVDVISIDGKTLGVWATPGVYTFTAMIPDGDDVLSTEVVLTITGSVVVPVTDKMALAAKAAYDSEPVATRAADKSSLIAVYRAAADDLADIVTGGDLFTVIAGATKKRIEGRLAAVRGVLNAEFARIMPAKTTDPLTAAHKSAAKDLLTQYATILEGLK